MPLHIVRNDITQMQVDAIVNAANESLLGGGGVDGCIHRAAGPQLLAECRTLGGCRVGQAKLTGGYRLPCRYVIHTVGPRWRGGAQGEPELLRACYRNALALAEARGCGTVAFPLISSGVFGYPKDKALQVAVETIGAFLAGHEMTVYLVIFDRRAYQIGEALYAEIAAYIDDQYVQAHTDAPAEQLRRAAAMAGDDTLSFAPCMPEEGDAAQVNEEEPEMLMLLCPRAEEAAEKPSKAARRKEPPAPAAAPSAFTASGSAQRKERPAPAAPSGSSAPPAFAVPVPPESAAPAAAAPARQMQSLNEALQRLDESFSEMLLRKIDEAGITDAQCYKKANIDRKLFSKIRSDKQYRPSKPTALAFAIALELPLAETREMLEKAGFALSHSSKFDIIVEYFIRHGNYNVFEINEALFAFDQNLLGA